MNGWGLISFLLASIILKCRAIYIKKYIDLYKEILLLHCNQINEAEMQIQHFKENHNDERYCPGKGFT